MLGKRRLFGIVAALFLVLVLLCGMGVAAHSPKQPATTLAALQEPGRRIGVATGSYAERVAIEKFPHAEIVQYKNVSDGNIAVKTGKIDAFCFTRCGLQYVVNANPDLMLLPETLAVSELVMGLRPGSGALRDEINHAIRTLRNNGTIEEMKAWWLSDSLDPATREVPKAVAPKRKLVVGVSNEDPPMGYLDENNSSKGLDVEMARWVALELNAEIEFRPMEWSALIPSLSSGKIDFIVALLMYTDERAKNMVLTVPYVEDDVLVMIRNPEASIAENGGVFAALQHAVSVNLLSNKRYLRVFEGLGVTLSITLLALLIGLLLGALLCALHFSRFGVLRWISHAYTVILERIPIVVLLMIVCYLVFARATGSLVWTAAFAFGLQEGAAVAGILVSGIQTVDPGQIEAARGMGFSVPGAFFTVTLPQALRFACPLYQSDVIRLIKSTAVVGYVSIVDLTKAGDIIRSQTYDAYFPLLLVGILYLILVLAVLVVFRIVIRLTDKRARY